MNGRSRARQSRADPGRMTSTFKPSPRSCKTGSKAISAPVKLDEHHCSVRQLALSKSRSTDDGMVRYRAQHHSHPQ